jgi:hypothetical protein
LAFSANTTTVVNLAERRSLAFSGGITTVINLAERRFTTTVARASDEASIDEDVVGFRAVVGLPRTGVLGGAAV